ncbi:MAG: cysteine desulfurase [Bacteroidales bacterium]
MFDIQKIRQDFPVLSQKVHGHPLVYFDNGATTQKPRQVIDAVTRLHTEQYSSIHRGVHYLSEQATEQYEQAREKVRAFINAKQKAEIIFTSGATGSINAVAFSYGERYILEGDEVIVSEMEHHANIVPWQMMCERKKARLRVIPFSDPGIIDMKAFERLLNKKTKIVAVTHVSNTLGTINPVKEIVARAHAHGVPVLVDGAQAIQHMQVDVQEMDCDFYVFSGHKVYGPTGIGVLYGKEEYLFEMPPYQGGGDMVDCVKFDHTSYNELPFKFEAGTTNFVGAIGLGTALDYLLSLGFENLHRQEIDLLKYGRERLGAIPGIRFFGDAPEKIATFSFLLGSIHPYDTGMILDKLGIAVRTGTHCTQPIMDHYEIDGTMRASLAFYNTREEIDRLCTALERARSMFS